MTQLERPDVARHPQVVATGPGVAVPGNSWDLLVPPPDHTWTPTATVSVCIPSHNARGLSRTLAALALQTYPLDLVEVVVVDDGSDPPLDLGDGWPFRLRVVRNEPDGRFSAGRARNTAAGVADGQILLFLDADVVPERQVIEAYARWFERCPIAVATGVCAFVDMDGLTSEELVAAVAAGTLAERLAGREVDDQSWRERTFARTDDLKVEAIDAFRTVIGATLAVSAEQFHAVGGFRDLGVRGIEDTELGYRLHADGAVLIVDRDARHWHQGRRSISTRQRAVIEAARAPYVERLLPLPGFRSVPAPPHGPVDTVPVLLVHISGAGAPDEVVARLAERIEQHCGTDVRVVTSTAELSRCQPSFATMSLPATMHWGDTTLPAIVRTFAAHDVGVIRVLDPTGSAPFEIYRTRALRRAQHVMGGTGQGADTVACVAALFGAWWVHPAHLGLLPPAEGPPTDGGTTARPSFGGRLLATLARRSCALAYRALRRLLRAMAA